MLNLKVKYRESFRPFAPAGSSGRSTCSSSIRGTTRTR